MSSGIELTVKQASERGINLTLIHPDTGVWSDDNPILDRTVDTYVKNLRLDCLVTVKGIEMRGDPMKRLKIFPKTFFYTLGLMLFIILVAHALLYYLTPQVSLDLSTGPGGGDLILTGQFNLTPYITQMIQQGLPIAILCCVVVSVLCSLLFSRQITVPVKEISAVAERMAQMDKSAVCRVRAEDEIGVLADSSNPCCWPRYASRMNRLP